MKKFTLFALALSFACVAVNSYAQDGITANHNVDISIPEVALLDIESSGTTAITFAFTAPTEAGLPIQAPSPNTQLWLNYSTISQPYTMDGPATRKISVKLNGTTYGVDLLLAAATYTGSGAGDFGTPEANPITLTENDQDLITEIGSSYTGDGTSNGHQLTYSLSFRGSNYSQLEQGTFGTNVVYTISDN
ncbi:hypothetical protein [Arundinibacter roseus]|uniref:DUF4402 domain-containing protein n=1 Tax=Arundinibacter roseus TaxID=2070510 RepID=A0A4R4JXE2_9BACT|nr:hypothetical protein [Arundinibacter roseus]TDB59537.1 hypothetical protein EZE20_22295 [Arundinibacter roseus]